MRLLLYTKCHLRNSIFLWTLTGILHNIHSHLLINNSAYVNLGSLSSVNANVSILASSIKRRGNAVQFYIRMQLNNILNGNLLFNFSQVPLADYIIFSLRELDPPYNIVNNVSVWVSADKTVKLYTPTPLNGTFYLSGEYAFV